MSLVVLQIINAAVSVYIWILIARAIMSWLPGLADNVALRPVVAFVHELTEPFLSLFRRAIPMAVIGGVGFDFSILIAIITLEVIRQLLTRLLYVFLF